MARVACWPEKMQAAIEAHDYAFEWGVNDCCLFCADVVLAVTGVDHMAEFRGQYRTALGGAKLIRELGHKTLLDCLERKFGKSGHVSRARRGDLVFENVGLSGPRIGICLGDMSVFVGEKGLVYQKTLLSERCLHV